MPLGPAGGHRTQLRALWTLQASQEGSGLYQPPPRALPSQPLEKLRGLISQEWGGKEGHYEVKDPWFRLGRPQLCQSPLSTPSD